MVGTLRTSTDERRHVQVRQFGPHVAWVEEPDIFGIRFSGPVKADELRGIFAWQDEWGQDKHPFFVLCDLSELGSVSQETRNCMHERTGHDHDTISVCHGMSFTIRILVEMVDRARRYLGRDPRSELILVAAETDARAYIEKRRARR
jgi:hypothetical protein